LESQIKIGDRVKVVDQATTGIVSEIENGSAAVYVDAWEAYSFFEVARLEKVTVKKKERGI